MDWISDVGAIIGFLVYIFAVPAFFRKFIWTPVHTVAHEARGRFNEKRTEKLLRGTIWLLFGLVGLLALFYISGETSLYLIENRLKSTKHEGKLELTSEGYNNAAENPRLYVTLLKTTSNLPDSDEKSHEVYFDGLRVQIWKPTSFYVFITFMAIIVIMSFFLAFILAVSWLSGEPDRPERRGNTGARRKEARGN